MRVGGFASPTISSLAVNLAMHGPKEGTNPPCNPQMLAGTTIIAREGYRAAHVSDGGQGGPAVLNVE